MDLVGVVLVAVVAFAVGTGLGLWLRRDAAVRPRPARTSRDGRQTAAPRTLQAIDTLVADSITRLAGWVRPGATSTDGSTRITLAPDGTLTLLFSDIAGSTRLNRRLGDDAFANLLRRHDEVVRDVVGAHDGHVVKTQGDGFFAVFAGAHDAVACGLELREVLAEPSHTGASLDLRIGVHTGRAVTEHGDVFGEAVAFAARVAAQARGGDLLVSSEVRERVEPEVADLSFAGRLLPSRLKGLPGLHQLHRVSRRTPSAA